MCEKFVKHIHGHVPCMWEKAVWCHSSNLVPFFYVVEGARGKLSTWVLRASEHSRSHCEDLPALHRAPEEKIHSKWLVPTWQVHMCLYKICADLLKSTLSYKYTSYSFVPQGKGGGVTVNIRRLLVDLPKAGGNLSLVRKFASNLPQFGGFPLTVRFSQPLKLTPICFTLVKATIK